MKVIRIFGFITLLSLIYIHLQMQIFDLAYQGKSKEKAVRELTELNGNETYTILKLKSANNLGDQLLDENSVMRFHGENEVVRIETPQPEITEARIALTGWRERSSAILNYLSFGAPAEARPQK